MPLVTQDHVFDATTAESYAGLINYLKYPDFLPGVTKVEVVKPKSSKAAVGLRYELNIIKTFYYELDMFHEENRTISWELVDSNLMKKNSGSWKLETHKKNKTLAKYTLEVDFKGLVPSAIIKKITESNLPGMFEGFQKLIDFSKNKK